MTTHKNTSILKLYYFKSFSMNGFTLVELLVTIIILGILVTIATPRFLNLLHNLEANDIRNKITNAIRTAKVESFTRHQYVIMCLANKDNKCHKNATDRLIVFTDANNNHSYDSTKDSILSTQLLNLNYGATYLRTSVGRHYVKFFGDTGLPRGHIGHIKYCPNSITNLNKYLVSFNQHGGIKFKPNQIYATNCPS